MAKRNKEVSTRYARYCALADSDKVSDHEFIYLKPGNSSHRLYKFGRVYVEFEPEGEVGKLSVRQPIATPSDYGFQLFTDEFTEPILRFDAEGPVHTNKVDSGKGLVSRVVGLPHFHRFNEKGEMDAYRNEEIEDSELELLYDVNKGLHCFCRECKIRSISDGKLFIVDQMELFLEDEPSDLHKGIDFP